MTRHPRIITVLLLVAAGAVANPTSLARVIRLAGGGTITMPHSVNDAQGNNWMIYQGGWCQTQGNQPMYSQGGMITIKMNGADLATLKAYTAEFVRATGRQWPRKAS